MSVVVCHREEAVNTGGMPDDEGSPESVARANSLRDMARDIKPGVAGLMSRQPPKRTGVFANRDNLGPRGQRQCGTPKLEAR